MNDQPYITERTKMWRTRELTPWFTETIDHIEEFGFRVVSVVSEELASSWSYTVGVYDTCGKPELVTVGLPYKVALSALNEAVERMRNGIDLTNGRHDDIIGDVDVEFHPVDPKWLHHIMLSTTWFYEEADVPVLQLIFPDLENRFPDQPGFDIKFAQPMLSGDIEYGSLEYQFWKSNAGPDDPLPLLN
jgi:hypothetical protein